jgi:hypothetical protein
VWLESGTEGHRDLSGFIIGPEVRCIFHNKNKMNTAAQVKRELVRAILIISIAAVGVIAVNLGIDGAVWALKGILSLGQ